jgi:site-specific DNA recombinase
MNAIIYCRVSTKEQTEGTSLESQRTACLEYAAKNNIKVIKTYVEMGESAKFADRTQLLKLIDFCKDKTNDVRILIVWKVDRFARNVVDHFQIKSLLAKSGVTINSVTEPINSNPEGKLMETMLAGFAQFDNDIRALRSVGGMARKIQEGLFPWKPPLGYLRASSLKEKVTKPDIPDPERFEVMKDAWRRLLSGTSTKADIVRFFAVRGLKTQLGRPITAQMADFIFSNKFYAGILANPWTKEKFAGKHLPMITPAEFYRIQDQLKERARNLPHRGFSSDFPLRGTLICPSCRRPLTGSWSRGHGGRYAYYHCYWRPCRSYGSVYPTSRLESEFLSRVNKLAPKKLLLPVVADRISSIVQAGRADFGKRDLAAKKQLAQLDDEKQQLIAMRSKNLIHEADFVVAYDRIRHSLEETKRSHAIEDSVGPMTQKDIRETLEFLSDLPIELFRMSPELRRRFQLLIFPQGILPGKVGTSQSPHIFSLIHTFERGVSNWVHPTRLEPRYDGYDFADQRKNRLLSMPYRSISMEKCYSNKPTSRNSNKYISRNPANIYQIRKRKTWAGDYCASTSSLPRYSFRIATTPGFPQLKSRKKNHESLDTSWQRPEWQRSWALGYLHAQ